MTLRETSPKEAEKLAGGTTIPNVTIVDHAGDSVHVGFDKHAVKNRLVIWAGDVVSAIGSPKKIGVHVEGDDLNDLLEWLQERLSETDRS